MRTVDVVSGGFPCQPFSVAGKRRGKEDDRFLWPEMLRIIKELRPAWVVGENVAGIISMAIDQVLSDLESIGYTCQAFVIPACAVDAPHRRDRCAIVAYGAVERKRGLPVQPWRPQQTYPDAIRGGKDVADADGGEMRDDGKNERGCPIEKRPTYQRRYILQRDYGPRRQQQTAQERPRAETAGACARMLVAS